MGPVRYYLGPIKLFLGKLLSIMKTVVLPLLLRCPLFDRPASALLEHSSHPIQERQASEEGGCLLTVWTSPPSKVPARRSSAPVAVSRHWYTEFYFVTLRGTFDTGSPMHIRTPRWRHSMIKILVNV